MWSFLVVIALCANTEAGEWIERDVAYPQHGPTDVAAVDLDGDGDVDLLGSAKHSDTVGWFENLGGEVYTHRQLSRDALEASSVVTGDLDGDGDLDVVSGSAQDDVVGWYENTGAGTFSERIVLSVATDGVSDVEVADLDGDGDLDVVAAAESQGDVVWFENLGGGLFNTSETLAVGNGPDAIDLADLDGDSDLDLVVAYDLGDAVEWLENLGGGVFAPAVTLDVALDGAVDVVAADLDGDGDLDVAAAADNAGELVWYDNLGGGVFGAAQILWSEAGIAGVAAGDVNGDGSVDLVGGSPATTTWIENIGGGVFAIAAQIRPQRSDALELVDVNLDGQLDVVTCDVLGEIAWVDNNTFAANLVQGPTHAGDELTVADLDGDGDMDVVTGDYSTGGTSWFENLGGGQFDAVPNELTPSANGVVYVGVHDIDGNGTQDVIVAGAVDDEVEWFSGLGGGAFAGGIVIPTPGLQITKAHMGDVTGDGLPELFTVESGGGSDDVSVYMNLGGGTFGGATILTTRSVYYSVSLDLGDVDDDGDIDVLLGSSWEIGWLENLGGGSFAAPGPTQYIDGVGAVDVELVDLDSDGDLDLVAATADEEFKIYRNGGYGVFTAFGLPIAIPNLYAVASGDFDGDPAIDLVTATYCAGCQDTAEWYQNLGGLLFAAPRAVGSDISSIGIADIDANGLDDVIAGERWSGRVAWFLNNDEDRDGDGLSNDDEALLGTDPDLADTDGDGDDDGTEVAAGTDPLNPDTDGDGVLDGADRCHGADDSIDLDADGVPDDCDICPLGPNYDDADGDGVPFACDVCPAGDDTLDVDLDGLPDACELIVPLAPSPWQRHVMGDLTAHSDVDAYDFDGDGDLDLVTGHAQGLAWHENLGGLAFGPQQILTDAPNDVRSVEIDDVDADGDPDLLYASAADSRVGWRQSTGSSLLPPGTVVSWAAVAPTDAMQADLDGDGILDVAIADSSGSALHWFLRNGDVTYGIGTPTSGSLSDVLSLDAGDLNGDGAMDLVGGAYEDFDGEILWFDNNGLAFQSQTIQNARNCPCVLYCIPCRWVRDTHLADIDGDGDLDVVTADDQKVFWYENLGAGLAWNRTPVVNGFWVDAVNTDDVDGDGALDVLTGGTSGVIVHGNPLVAPGFTQLSSTWTSTVGTADFDGDGDSDVFAASKWDHKVEIIEALGGGSFAAPTDVAVSPALGARVAARGDLDGDGDDDILAAALDADALVWYENTGSNTFSTSVVLAGGLARTSHVEAEDFDGDGDIDVVVGQWSAPSLVWFENTGGGALAPAVNISALQHARDVHLTDMDGDGDLDIIASEVEGFSMPLNWYENLGGSWSLANTITASTDQLMGIGSGDFNGDGDTDVTAVADWGPLYVFEQQVNGSFAVPAQVPNLAVNDYTGMAVGDLDGDGDDDIAFCADGNGLLDGAVYWTENLGGVFADPQAVDIAVTRATSVDAVDIDNDGDLDLLVSNGEDEIGQPTVILYANLGNGLFSSAQTLSLGNRGVMSLLVHDIDGDGDLDLVTPAADEGAVSWLENPLINPADADGDGLYEDEEIALGLDPANPDSDGDGLLDGDEVFEGGSDPNDGDSDGDGVLDINDVCDGGDDTLDADGDGVPDFCDICGLGDDNFDSDADTVPDACDLCPFANDRVDDDGDGAPDACDQCPGFDDLLDDDADGVPDDCDLCEGDDLSGDSDEDGHCLEDADGMIWDCDDLNPTLYPDAPELCDGLDNACAGAPPDEDVDNDGDGRSICADDCDDLDPDVSPDFNEVCGNGIDDDCSGEIDEGCQEPDSGLGGGAIGAKGSCGCATGSSPSWPALAILLVPAFLRRRRQEP